MSLIKGKTKMPKSKRCLAAVLITAESQDQL